MQAIEKLRNVAEQIGNKALRDICLFALNDPLWEVAPASFNKHHVWKGGLADHVWEVTFYAFNMAGSLGVMCEMDVLICAVILHDYLKTREYSWNDLGPVALGEYRQIVRHVAGSAAWFYAQAEMYVARQELEPEIVDRVMHAMLAHHGKQEWGSPVEPRTIEALLIHTADMMSARWTPEGKWRGIK